MYSKSVFRRLILNCLLIISLMGISGGLSAKSVFADHTPSPVEVTIVGDLQDELGCSGDWQADCVETYLVEYGAGVWQATFNVPSGNWLYKAALNSSWDENYGANAIQDGANILLNLAAPTDVKFYYDHKTHWITDNWNSVIATATGSFQSELGCPGDWQPDCLLSWLQDPDGDGIFVFSTTTIPAGSYEAKVAINESLNENYGQGGTLNGPSIPFTVPGDGSAVIFSYDSVSHLLTITISVSILACNGGPVDFETGIPAAWTVVDNSGGTGIAWTTTADTTCDIPNYTTGSGDAACADSDAAGPAGPYDTELVSNPFDLSGIGAAVLDVKAYYFDLDTGTNDRFEVDVWDGTSWNNELSWDEDHTPEDFTLNLSAFAGLPNVQVRFRYFGDGFDWYAQVDDIALTCVPAGPPSISVDPISLSSSQAPTNVVTQPLRISNSGGSPLNWNILEDDNACDSPTDIPWLSVSPDAGTTMQLDTTQVDVAFDSTGLSAGDYSANLCVNSNDPGTSLVQVPVSLTVYNVFPVADPNGPYIGAVNTAIIFNGSGSSDPDGDPLTYDWDFGDSNSGTGVAPTHTYTEADIYDVCLTVNDGVYDSEEVCTIAVVYDPSAGFVTGGGWFTSLAGAYTPDPSLTGEATFGFVAKYKKGANVPNGNAEFQFSVADLFFKSTSYDWLVVAGKKAIFKGEGTINELGIYKFKISAEDDNPDTFRIKIWYEDNGVEVIVYDNGSQQELGGGSIVIHTPKK